MPRPLEDNGMLYSVCASSSRKGERSDRLLALIPDVAAAARRYVPAAHFGGLHLLRDLAGRPEDPADHAALLWLYEKGLVQNSMGRQRYDDLLSRAPMGRCPFCGHRDVSTLDHQLPKSSYPLLAVLPDNLVPACSDCNHRKNDKVAASSQTQTFHPYFENANHGRWLVARVVSLDPIAVVFAAEPDAAFTTTTQARIRHQFVQFRLAALYGPQAVQQISGERLMLDRLRQHSGLAAVGEYLREAAASWAAARSVNCWQHALYEALAADPGFLTGT
ncbi:HNH endonuclease [Actinoplanes derwentensis]|uniref:HNH endonuclease n=1 Tax=Actinoplanes derwentensis TaxID=113562 RepID=UPI001944797F|nr:hypothetical protein [Actinoplanes derwentensis]